MESYFQQNWRKVKAGVYFNLTEQQKQSGLLLDAPSQMNVDVQLRWPVGDLPKTDQFTDSVKDNKKASEFNYVDSGFITLLNELHMLVTQDTLNQLRTEQTQAINISIQTQRFPVGSEAKTKVPPIRDSVRANFILYVAGPWLVTGVLPFFYKLLSELVHEKETKIRVAMRIMGLSSAAYWFTWFTFTFLFTLLPSYVLVGLLRWALVYEHSDISALFIVQASFNLSLTALSCMLSVFFARAKLAAPVGSLVIITMSVIGVLMSTNKHVTSSLKIILSLLFSPVAYGICHSNIIELENKHGGLSFASMSDENPSTWTLLVIMWFDTVFYLVLGWYLDRVLPGEFGVNLPFYFIFLPSYWLGYYNKKEQDLYSDVNNDDEEFADIEMNIPSMAERRAIVKIRKLRKVFGNGTVAVNNLNLDFQEDQITAFLGHNGAGLFAFVSRL